MNIISEGKIDRILKSINEVPQAEAKLPGSLENIEYQDVTVKANAPKEDALLASGSKYLPTEGDEQSPFNPDQTEELPSIGTELVKKKSVKVFDNVQNKVELEKKRKSDHFGQVINVIKLEESQEEIEDEE